MAKLGLTRVEDASQEPISLAEAKVHLRVDHTADDALITRTIKAARQYVERACGHALLPQIWRQSFDHWPDFASAPVYLYRFPVTAIASATIDQGSLAIDLEPEQFRLDPDSMPCRVTPAYGVVLPEPAELPGAIKITFDAGYATVEDIPAELLQAVYMTIGDLYENREGEIIGTGSKRLEHGLAMLIASHRLHVPE